MSLPYCVENVVEFVKVLKIILKIEHIVARLAQSVEHETLNLRVVGSSPTLGDQTFYLNKINFFVKPGRFMPSGNFASFS